MSAEVGSQPFEGIVTPASYVQRSMWAVAQRYPNAPLNVMILPWRVKGRLQVRALEASIGDLLARHPTLRARLVLRSGQLHQVAAAPCGPVPINVEAVDGATPEDRLQGAISALREEGRKRIDVISGPSLKVRLLRLAETDHVLCFFVHHAMCDGWSSQVMVQDLSALYGAHLVGESPDLPAIVEQYSDFAAWQIKTYESGGFANEIGYWRTELADLPPPLALEAVGARKGNRDWRAESPAYREGAQVLQALRTFARERRLSLFSLLLGILALLLHQRTGANDFVVGVPTLNRRSKESMHFVGCATNLLPARIRIDGRSPFGEVCGQVHATIRRLLAYGRIPLELVLRETQSSLLAGPVFPVWCQFRDAPTVTVDAVTGLTWRQFLIERGTLLGELDVDMIETSDGFVAEFCHRPAIFAAAMVGGLIRDYEAVLRAFLDEPDASVGKLEQGLRCA